MLLVAGPSAVGKTTFLARLTEDDLPRSVAAALPAGSGEWPQVEAWALEQWVDTRPRGEEIEGVVVHFDLWRLRNPRLPCPDPAVAVLAQARAVTVVTLTSSRARLLSQVAIRLRRPAQRRRRRHVRLVAVLAARPRIVLLTLAINVAALLPGRAASALLRRKLVERLWGELGDPQRHTIEALAAYLRPGWLSALQRDWSAMLRAVLPAGSEVVVLEPGAASTAGRFEWQIRPDAARGARGC